MDMRGEGYHMQDLRDFMKDWGFPGALVIIGILIFTGAVASPITETKDLLKAHVAATDSLKGEVIKVVRLLGVMCLNNAKNPESCIDAVIPAVGGSSEATTSVLKGALGK
jgi:hypothetical protein